MEVCQNETALLRWVLMSLPQSWQYLGLPVSDTYKKKKKKIMGTAIQILLSDKITISSYSAHTDIIPCT